MRKLILLVFASLFWVKAIYSQNDSSIENYANFRVQKYYQVNLKETQKGKKSKYFVNDRRISKSEFEKFNSDKDRIGNCIPCIVERYNENDILIKQAYQYTDCYIGFYKEFYPNGKIKKEGQFKENLTEDWEDLSERGLCSKKTGKWIFYSENGDTLYSEFWGNGEFIKQVPEQTTNEIWNVDFTLDGATIENKTITTKQMNQIKITPKFKNSSKMSNNFFVRMKAYDKKGMAIEKSCSIDGLSRIDFDKILEDAKVLNDESLKFQISLYNHNKIIDLQFVWVKK